MACDAHRNKARPRKGLTMRTMLHWVRYPAFGMIGYLAAPLLPEAELLEVLRYIFLGGVAGNLIKILHKLVTWAKGDLKPLVSSPALSGRGQTRLAQAWVRRSRMIWAYLLWMIGLLCAGWILLGLHSKEMLRPHSLRLSVACAAMSIPLLLTLLSAHRDYIRAREKLTCRESGVPDVE